MTRTVILRKKRREEKMEQPTKEDTNSPVEDVKDAPIPGALKVPLKVVLYAGDVEVATTDNLHFWIRTLNKIRKISEQEAQALLSRMNPNTKVEDRDEDDNDNVYGDDYIPRVRKKRGRPKKSSSKASTG
jgi:hypothetical protein